MQKLVAYFLTAVIPIIWSGDLFLSRGFFTSVPPFTLVFLKFSLVALVLFPFAWKSILNDWEEIKESWGTLSIVSLVGVTVFIALLYIGLKSTRSINGGLLETTLPALMVLFFVFLYGKQITKIQAVGLALCFLGSCYVVNQGGWGSSQNLDVVRSDLLVLVTAVIYGLYSGLMPKSHNIAPISFLVCVMLLAKVTILPFFVWEVVTVGFPEITANMALSLLYLTVLAVLPVFIYWGKGTSIIGRNKIGVLVVLLPAFSAMMAIPLVELPLKFYHIIGMLMVYSGMILFNNNAPLYPTVKETEEPIHPELEAKKIKAAYDFIADTKARNTKAVNSPQPVEPEVQRSKV